MTNTGHGDPLLSAAGYKKVETPVKHQEVNVNNKQDEQDTDDDASFHHDHSPMGKGDPLLDAIKKNENRALHSEFQGSGGDPIMEAAVQHDCDPGHGCGVKGFATPKKDLRKVGDHEEVHTFLDSLLNEVRRNH